MHVTKKHQGLQKARMGKSVRHTPEASWGDPGSTLTSSVGSMSTELWSTNTANTRHWANVELMLGRRHRRRANINPTLAHRLVFAGKAAQCAWAMTYDIEFTGWRTWWRPHWKKIFQSIWWRLQCDVSSLCKMCHSWHGLMTSVRLKLGQLQMCQNCTWMQGSVIHTTFAANVSDVLIPHVRLFAEIIECQI